MKSNIGLIVTTLGLIALLGGNIGIFSSRYNDFEKSKADLTTEVNGFKQSYLESDLNISNNASVQVDAVDLCFSLYKEATSRYTPSRFVNKVRNLNLECKDFLNDVVDPYKSSEEKRESLINLVNELNEPIQESYSFVDWVSDSIYFYGFLLVLAGWIFMLIRYFEERRDLRVEKQNLAIQEAIDSHKKKSIENK